MQSVFEPNEFRNELRKDFHVFEYVPELYRNSFATQGCAQPKCARFAHHWVAKRLLKSCEQISPSSLTVSYVQVIFLDHIYIYIYTYHVYILYIYIYIYIHIYIYTYTYLYIYLCISIYNLYNIFYSYIIQVARAHGLSHKRKIQ